MGWSSMQIRFAALSCALILFASGAQAKTTVAQPVAPPIAVSVRAPMQVAPAGPPVLRNGTPVPLRLLETLTTKGKNLRSGYRFRMETVEPVIVNGQVVIPVGSPATGEITEVRNKGMWGKSGKFAGRVLYVIANGRQIRMSGQMDDKGTAGGAGAVAVSAIVFLPAGFFMTGTSASLPIGTPVQGFIDEDVALAPAPAATPMVVGAPVAVGGAPTALTQIAAVTPSASSINGMPDSAKRYAQRDEYIRLTGRLGYTPTAAKIAVEKKYRISME